MYLDVRPPAAFELFVDDLRTGEVGDVSIFKRSMSFCSVMGDDM